MTTLVTNTQLGIFDAGKMNLDDFGFKLLNAALPLLQSTAAEQIPIRQLSGAIGCVPSTLLNKFSSYQLCWQFIAEKCFSYWLDIRLNRCTQLADLADCLYELAAEQPYVWRLIFEYAPDQAAHLIDHSLSRQQIVCSALSGFIRDKTKVNSLWCMLFGFCRLLVTNRLDSSDHLVQYQALKCDLIQLCQTNKS
ncbi:hypothetical protein ACMZOO_09600 [Catenovulum sp. SX2]|uniref:hypothetical protein n=1 Tax=Catenovulum sp. SX2 TaxID=3398614 RepID=UPI003F8343E4